MYRANITGVPMYTALHYFHSIYYGLDVLRLLLYTCYLNTNRIISTIPFRIISTTPYRIISTNSYRIISTKPTMLSQKHLPYYLNNTYRIISTNSYRIISTNSYRIISAKPTVLSQQHLPYYLKNSAKPTELNTVERKKEFFLILA